MAGKSASPFNAQVKAQPQSLDAKIAQHVSNMLDEFSGQKITKEGKNRPALEMRIAGMIKMHVSEERHRCYEFANIGAQLTLTRILDTPEGDGFAVKIKKKQPGDVMNGSGDLMTAHGRRCTHGIMVVTMEQADEAEKFGWKKQGAESDCNGVILVRVERE